MIEAKDLTKYYGDLKAVDGLTFSIESGKIVGLLGPNGAGKTTTLRLLTGFMPPTSGRVTVAGYDLMENPREAKRQMGYLPERLPLYPEMTVKEYLSFVAHLHGVNRSERGKFVHKAMDRTAVLDVQNRIIGNLSRGYQQRVGLAQVLVKKPKVLILDEPMVGLDPKQISEIRQVIKDLAGDYTVILSSHILQEVSATCDQVIIIHQGRSIAQDTQENLLRHTQDRECFRIKLKGAELDEVQVSVHDIQGVENVDALHRNGLIELRVSAHRDTHFPENLFALIKEKGWIPYELTPEHSSLEEVFLQLTSEAVVWPNGEHETKSRAEKGVASK